VKRFHVDFLEKIDTSIPRLVKTAPAVVMPHLAVVMPHLAVVVPHLAVVMPDLAVVMPDPIRHPCLVQHGLRVLEPRT
jgi:hypothetical protein